MRSLLFLLLLTFVLGGCSDGSTEAVSAGQSSSNSPQTATFRVQIPPVSSSVRAQGQSIDRVTVTFTSGGQIVRRGEAPIGVGQTAVDFTFQVLNPGQYVVRADGFSGTQLIATDSESVTLVSGVPTTIELVLSFVQALTVSPGSVSLTPGSTQQLTANRGTNPVTASWQSSNANVAGVSNTGLVTAVAPGTATITASEGGNTADSTVTVSNTVVLNSIAVTPVNNTINPGNTLQYTAIGTFSDNSTLNLTSTVTWSTTATSIATISTGGLATGVAGGTTTVTAATLGVSGSTGLTVRPTFALYFTESPGGPTNNNMATWGGVRGFLVQGTGGSFVATTGIPTAQLNDPADLLFRPSSSEVFVSNRHGNNSTGGLAGSVSRFIYDPVARTFTPHGSFSTPSPAHQLAFSPVSGELFVGMVGPESGFFGGVARFTFDMAGNAVPNGILSSGPIRGVAVSPDGERLYATTAGNVIRQFDLANGGTELTPITVAGSPNLHWINISNGQLYVAALSADQILRYDIEANNDLTFKEIIPAASPIAVEFSPDGQEMYATGHISSFVIHRFDYDTANDAWVPTTPVSTGASLGGLLVLP